MNWHLFIPELSMVSAAALFLVLACLRPDANKAYLIAVTAAAVSVAICLACIPLHGDLFSGAYRVDRFSQVFKCLLSIGFFLVAFLCSELNGIRSERHAELYFLLTVCTLAMMLMASGMHLLIIYLALELSSYALYVMVLMRSDARQGLGSGMSYFLVGISASAIMLFGMALTYGATGALYLQDIAATAPEILGAPMTVAGILLTLGGFFFKLAVFPFHFWAPEAYQGAPNQVATFISTVSKVAAVAILVRVISPLQGMDMLVKAMIVMAVVSMTVGNLCAIAQKDFKRLMAFSSIAQAGYLMIGILCMSAAGFTGTIFYVTAVLAMKFTCFMVMVTLAGDGHNLQVSELAGLHRRSPLLAMALMMALFGLAGIPPTIGFTGKLLIFKAAIAQGYLALVIIAMANVVLSLYYYLMLLKAAYLDEPLSEPPLLAVTLPTKMLALTMIAFIVVAGISPNTLLEWVSAAVQGLGGRP